MINDTFQNILVGMIVATALCYVGRRAWLLLHGKSSGHCAGCNACQTTSLVQLELRDNASSPSDSDQRNRATRLSSGMKKGTATGTATRGASTIWAIRTSV